MMERLWFLLIWLLAVLVCFGAGQEPLRARSGPWRHRIQWENNGQFYSLLSTGTEYRSPSQRRTQLLLTTKNSLNQIQPPAALSGSTRAGSGAASRDQSEQMDASVLAADAGQYLLTSGRPGTHSRPHRAPSNGTSIQEFSGGGVLRGGRSAPEDAQRASPAPARAHDPAQRRVPRVESESSDSPPASVWVTLTEDQTRAQSLTRASPESNDSPPSAVEIHVPRRRPETTEAGDRRGPHSIHHRNSVFYNVYPQDRRSRQNGLDPAGTGYGTRFFHNGEESLQRKQPRLNTNRFD